MTVIVCLIASTSLSMSSVLVLWKFSECQLPYKNAGKWEYCATSWENGDLVRVLIWICNDGWRISYLMLACDGHNGRGGQPSVWIQMRKGDSLLKPKFQSKMKNAKQNAKQHAKQKAKCKMQNWKYPLNT